MKHLRVAGGRVSRPLPSGTTGVQGKARTPHVLLVEEQQPPRWTSEPGFPKVTIAGAVSSHHEPPHAPAGPVNRKQRTGLWRPGRPPAHRFQIFGSSDRERPPNTHTSSPPAAKSRGTVACLSSLATQRLVSVLKAWTRLGIRRRTA